ncbi:LysR family transcriptional regulator [Novosphingobium sp. FSY-8]|uniref:LysR family transcriptional regulator n=1 Tax=Novosphingobium ovatum TaxID=1908523 RepID=A0ABW9X928_9SPHN|nr:LysR family transcriptional regulator [Novosphingobium ovatum]NBC35019.1 LysR family transcriptional regulator [Novosphingobium ovatum]
MTAQPPRIKITLRLYCGEEIAMGPGKADLLDAIIAEGSISAAGRAMGMSYRRAWLLVDAMNRCWQAPLVSASPGTTARATPAEPRRGGGAHVTPTGHQVLNAYRAMQAHANAAVAGQDWATLSALLRDQPLIHQPPRD